MLKHIIALIAFSLILISCGEKKNEPGSNTSDKEKYSFDSTDLRTEGIDNSGKPFFIRYKFSKGEKLTYRLTAITNNTQTITVDTSMSRSINQKITYLIDMSIKDVDDEGTVEAEVKVSSVKLEASAAEQKFNFEAGKDVDSASIDQFAEYQALYQNPFNVRFNQKGEILEIYKADKISNKFLELKGAADTISTNDRNSIRANIINGVLNPMITQIIRRLTDKEVYKDSLWQIPQTPMPLMVYQIDYTNIYKIENVEKLDGNRIAVIGASVDFKFSGNSKFNQGNVSYSFGKPISVAEGKIYFDVDKGLQIKSRTKTRIEISYSMEADTPQGRQKGTETDVNIQTNILELL